MQGWPTVYFAHRNLAAGEQGPEQHASGLGAGQQALRLDPPLELLVQAFDGVTTPEPSAVTSRHDCRPSGEDARLIA
jgi:hypothetical protein